MEQLEAYEVWLVTGSQHLYGEVTLREVGEHSRHIARFLNDRLEVRVVSKPVVTTPEEITAVCRQANSEEACIGIITWMHTFSPAKMWISGLKALQQPVLHLHTQYNRDIPWESIDMDFMNLNQSAHGDREFGYIMTRMQLPRKVVVGHWQDPDVLERINVWSRVALARNDLRGGKVIRFGDNMREVAVTEGDKVAAEIKFGFSVNTYAVGDLVSVIHDVAGSAVSELTDLYEASYAVAPALRKGGDRHACLQDAARIELGMRRFLEAHRAIAFTNTFEDLHGMKQLPGIATQRLMASGYGYGGEGDWKTAALVRALKVMGRGFPGGTSFMEDYTYHFDPENALVLGAHMLEVCPSVAEGVPSCEIHPLGIGGKEDPVRLVFNAAAGAALNASLIDLGGRYRLVVNEVTAVPVVQELPLLPVARALWKPHPDLKTALAAWIYAGGAHHTAFSQNLSAEYLEDFAEMTGVELVVIDNDTRLRPFRDALHRSDVSYGNHL